jgi:hypothetical protein
MYNWRSKNPAFKAAMNHLLQNVTSYKQDARNYLLSQLEAKSMLFLSTIIDAGLKALNDKRSTESPTIRAEKRATAFKAIDKVIRLIELNGGLTKKEESKGWLEMIHEMRDGDTTTTEKMHVDIPSATVDKLKCRPGNV